MSSSSDSPRPIGAAAVPTALNGRGPKGRFAPGNKCARGNPNNRRAAAIRATLLRSLTTAAAAEIIDTLIEQAKAGDIQAVREVFDRTIGRSSSSEVLQRLAAIEDRLGIKGDL